jgi:hypothetical protein
MAREPKHKVSRRFGESVQIVTAHFSGKSGAGDRRSSWRYADSERIQALVATDARKQLLNGAAVVSQDQILNWFVDGAGNEACAQIEIAHEPAQRQTIHERDDGVCKRRQRQRQRHRPQAQRRRPVAVLAAPEVVLVDLEHVDEGQRPAEEQQRDERGAVGVDSGAEQLHLPEEARRGRHSRDAERADRGDALAGENAAIDILGFEHSNGGHVNGLPGMM